MRAALLLLLLLAACAPSVPDEPSFQQHVAPILAANCVRCHGAPAIGGAPLGFRLDVIGSYDQPLRTGVELVAGAAAYAGASAQRAAADEMPPRFPLDAYQVETLARWAELEAPRGAPNPGNRPPTASIASAGILVEDPDDDLVGGVLRLDGVPIAALRSGPNAISLTAGTLEAVLDDGGIEVTIPLGEVP